jgi:hypothetical protein
MKITDDEREAAYELKWMVQQILFERERAALYARIYMEAFRAHGGFTAGVHAKRAIDEMEKALEPVCDTCKDGEE